MADGQLEVAQGGRPLTRLGRDDCFGEIALVFDVPRTASVTAITEARLYALERAVFLPVVTGCAEARVATETLARARLEAAPHPGTV